VPDPSDHDLTLSLFEKVADELQGEERDRVLADLDLIRDLLRLGSEPTVAEIADWARDADHG
jgi:hypothetical protein